MKRTPLINKEVSSLVASLGHLDEIVIADAGLPAPANVPVIDLALTYGVPRFAEIIRTLRSELIIEQAIWADEASPELSGLIDLELSIWREQQQDKGITEKRISHEHFKTRTSKARAIIRSGEATPYANIILVSGVAF
ncbi:D-ribose pyranase [Flexibacterium corallicola]|uniref:D-ribose pyranase n=1 Tax=Flexibacterium corallicola TaxID=3037259 RepID=UPI00286F9E21|nr:D-ribose pyranase [Pseudovibrio sp. M1P-2-3]